MTPLGLRGGYLRLPMSLTIAVATLKFLSGMEGTVGLSRYDTKKEEP